MFDTRTAWHTRHFESRELAVGFLLPLFSSNFRPSLREDSLYVVTCCPHAALRRLKMFFRRTGSSLSKTSRFVGSQPVFLRAHRLFPDVFNYSNPENGNAKGTSRVRRRVPTAIRRYSRLFRVLSRDLCDSVLKLDPLEIKLLFQNTLRTQEADHGINSKDSRANTPAHFSDTGALANFHRASWLKTIAREHNPRATKRPTCRRMGFNQQRVAFDLSDPRATEAPDRESLSQLRARACQDSE